MSATPPSPGSDAAMLAWLAGDDEVNAAANRIWAATGRITECTAALHVAQVELEAATVAYSKAIRACRIPAEHADRLGAALILRVGRSHLLAELDDPGPADDGLTQ